MLIKLTNTDGTHMDIYRSNNRLVITIHKTGETGETFQVENEDLEGLRKAIEILAY